MKTCKLAASSLTAKIANQRQAVFKKLCFIKLNARPVNIVNICVPSKINQNVTVNNITPKIYLNTI